MSVEEEIRDYQKSCKGNFQMINERPKGMSFEAYRLIQKMQKAGVKKYIKGQMIYVAKNLLQPLEKGVPMVKNKTDK